MIKGDTRILEYGSCAGWNRILFVDSCASVCVFCAGDVGVSYGVCYN